MKLNRRHAWGVAKITVAGASIWGISLAVLSIGPEGEVAKSEADVWEFGVFQTSESQKFARALEALGHEPPRVYDNNGNTIFFSTRMTTAEPHELVQEYQHAFVAEGVNREVHLTTPDVAAMLNPEGEDAYHAERHEDLLTGEVLPFAADPHYMMMGGGLMRGAPVNVEELNRQLDHANEQNMADIVAMVEQAYFGCGGSQEVLDAAIHKVRAEAGEDVAKCEGSLECRHEVTEKLDPVRIAALRQLITAEKEQFKRCPILYEAARRASGRAGFDSMMTGFRSIEAFRDPEARSTAVTAVWSDDDFDMRRALPEKHGIELELDADVPRCPGCTATWDFGGNGAEEGMGNTLLFSNARIQEVEGFYKSELERKGWKRVEGDIVMDKIFAVAGNPMPNARALRFERDGEFLRVLISSDERTARTNVSISRTPE